MHIIVAFVALGLLVVVVYPLVSKRLRAAHRSRAVHLDGSCHWYANYDEDLRYEPKRGKDIVRLTRSALLARGYKPGDEVQVVPRTFRHRVPGDTKIRLWRSDREGVPPLWLCEWAVRPIRVAIGERESVPGVESGPIPDVSWDGPEGEPASDAVAALGDWDVAGHGSGPPTDRPRDAGSNDWRDPDRLAGALPPGVASTVASEAAVAGNDGEMPVDAPPGLTCSGSGLATAESGPEVGNPDGGRASDGGRRRDRRGRRQ